MDKLAMEEAGFRNCVSVPDGAPPSVSKKELPPEEKVFFVLKILNYVSWIKIVKSSYVSFWKPSAESYSTNINLVVGFEPSQNIGDTPIRRPIAFNGDVFPHGETYLT